MDGLPEELTEAYVCQGKTEPELTTAAVEQEHTRPLRVRLGFQFDHHATDIQRTNLIGLLVPKRTLVIFSFINHQDS